MSDHDSTVPEWHRAHGGAAGSGVLRAEPEDFRVDEQLGFEASGEGEHVLLHIEKRDANTDWVAQSIARLAGVTMREVGYAGMKDRRAVTTQWFSVGLAGREDPDWSALEDGSVRVLAAHHHHRKLRRGALSGNRFALRIRDLQADPAVLEARLAAIAEAGFPNYFGPQRFGRDGGNIERARRLLSGKLRERNRNKRGIYLSAARSLLFNGVLDARVVAGSWDRPLPGEALQLDGKHAYFIAEQPDAEIERRIAEFDVHPSGPLWGSGDAPPVGEAAAAELAALDAIDADGRWRRGLAKQRLDQERRPLRVRAQGLEWEIGDRWCELRFGLPAGSYATSLLREALDGRDGPSA